MTVNGWEGLKRPCSL
jgi:hypothetical protein